MVLENISLVARIGMGLQILFGFGLPIALMYLMNKKLKAKFSSFYLGCIVYFVAVFILESLVNNAVFKDSGDVLNNNVVLFALYAGAAAAVFEEVGRFIAFRFFMKDRLNVENGIMYGIGHGGLEAILILGLNGVNTLITSIMVNNGTLEKSFESMDEAMIKETYDAVAALWTTQAWVYYVGVIERIFAVLFHIALSIIVYKAVKSKHSEIVAHAMIIHFIMDFATVVFSKTLPTAVTETLVALLSIATVYYAITLVKDELAQIPALSGLFSKPWVMKLFKIEPTAATETNGDGEESCEQESVKSADGLADAENADENAAVSSEEIQPDNQGEDALPDDGSDLY